jgi:hypothetical protein
MRDFERLELIHTALTPSAMGRYFDQWVSLLPSLFPSPTKVPEGSRDESEHAAFSLSPYDFQNL